jgi:ankyrin repeat protein
MRSTVSIAFASIVLLSPDAVAQTKNPLDGHDEGSLEFMKATAKDFFNDKRTLEQIFKDNALIRAVWTGDVKAVSKALEAGAIVNSYYIDGCAAFGSDASGHAALMEAVSEGHVDVVKLLIKAKADVNLKCINSRTDGETALYRAVKQNQEAIIALLVKAGAKGDPKQIRLGIEMRRAACRGFKLKEGQGYPNYPGAAGGDRALTIAEVLKKGADINAPDPGGYTPLMYAANLGLLDNVTTLLAHGADPTRMTYASVSSKGGVTALSLTEAESSYAPTERRQVAELLKARLAKSK